MNHLRIGLAATLVGVSLLGASASATEVEALRSVGYADGVVTAPEAGHEAAGDHAQDGHEAAGHAEEGHGDEAHGADAHGGAHGADHGPHYTGDVDGDGTANWMDADADETMGEGTYVLTSMGWHAFNLALFFAIVYFGFGSTIRDAVRGRAVRIRTELDEAQELRNEAVAHHDAIASRLAKLESEIAGMNDRADQDVAAEAARIEARAKVAATSVAETAKRQIADEAARASRALKAEAVELAVELAEGILTKQMKADDQQRLAAQFLASVDGEGSHV